MIVAIGFMSAAWADGPVVDKIYNPYVQPLEREIEVRGIDQNDDSDGMLDDLQMYRLGAGWSWSDRWSSEIYLIGQKTGEHSFKIQNYELETKWQLTEQGEYWVDLGLLFELEIPREVNIFALESRLLVVKEWGRWVTTANLTVAYEWGDDIASEQETALAVQHRFRMSRVFEPALELYAGQDSKGLGPVLMGAMHTGINKKWRWEFGVIIGLDSDSPDQTWRALIEYEF